MLATGAEVRVCYRGGLAKEDGAFGECIELLHVIAYDLKVYRYLMGTIIRYE